MKLLISDYDNTYELHYNNLNLTKIFNTNYKEVNNFIEKGNKFVIATGRHFDAIKQTIDEKKLKFDYLIANNGAEVYDKDYNLLCEIPIDKKSITIIKKLEFAADIFYRRPYSSKLVTSINIYFKNEEQYIKIKKILETSIDNCLIEYKYPKIKIINEKCNKVNGIEVIRKQESVDLKNIYVIGDDINDYEMIKKYNGFSLNNAMPKVKKIAKKNYNSLSNLIRNIMYKDI